MRQPWAVETFSDASPLDLAEEPAQRPCGLTYPDPKPMQPTQPSSQHSPADGILLMTTTA